MYIMSRRDLDDSKRFLSETLFWWEPRVAEENGQLKANRASQTQKILGVRPSSERL